MREFFKGWRRKVGVLLLGMACVLASLWIRSMNCCDSLRLQTSAGHLLVIRNYGGGIQIIRLNDPGLEIDVHFAPGQWIKWTSTATNNEELAEDPILASMEQSWFGVSFLRKTAGAFSFWIFIAPFHFPVITLTAISAYLILWKPRPKPKDVRMREFFKGWRRKTGCVALLLACMLGAIWLRSLWQHDILSFVAMGRCHVFFSWNGNCAWYAGNALPSDRSWSFRSHDIPSNRILETRLKDNSVLPHLARLNFGDQIPWKWKIDQWSLLPLTLLSAYLILWEPRPKPKEQPNA